MKIIVPMLLLFFAGAGFADDITTTDGKTYKGVEITKTEPDGITIMSDSGVEKIPFTSLPKDLQAKYGYDPDKAAAYAAQDAATQSQLFQANEKALKQKIAADNALAAGKPDDDAAKGPKCRVMMVVQEKTDDGVLLWPGPPGEFHDP
ncbi:MAG TPA: hypothetical protein VG733_08565, partial [Chthoniobacteraceae bacterium]|nr:hypothetical protein [Chthoniobacteraceae bacterium]